MTPERLEVVASSVSSWLMFQFLGKHPQLQGCQDSLGGPYVKTERHWVDFGSRLDIFLIYFDAFRCFQEIVETPAGVLLHLRVPPAPCPLNRPSAGPHVNQRRWPDFQKIRWYHDVTNCGKTRGRQLHSMQITWPEVAGILTSRSAKWAAASVAVPCHRCWRLPHFLFRGYVRYVSSKEKATVPKHSAHRPLPQIVRMLHILWSGRLYEISWRAFMSPPTSPTSIWTALEEHNPNSGWIDFVQLADIEKEFPHEDETAISCVAVLIFADLALGIYFSTSHAMYN